MSSSLRLGRVLGIELRLDYSWFIIFVLIAWSLASHYFPMTHPDWSAGTYWTLGILTSVLFFGGVVVHELAHSVVSQRYGIPVRDITLFIFGGAASLSEEPKRARDELLIALVGPAASLTLASVFGILWWLDPGLSAPLHALAGWLGGINLALGLFNLIPGSPLDGGRVFRAVVWGVTGNPRRATRIASRLGRLVAFAFIFWGIWQIFAGNWADGLWIAFIGWFLHGATASSDQQLALHDLLAGHTAREVMLTNWPQVPPRLTLDGLINQVVLPSGRRCFPVVDDGQLAGLITVQEIRNVPVNARATTRVEDVMIPRASLKTVEPGDDLFAALQRMAAEDVNQLPVLDDGRFVGMVARNRVVSVLHPRADLERESANRGSSQTPARQ
jgi:Zn-dependent protease/CBS domain-containing protein